MSKIARPRSAKVRKLSSLSLRYFSTFFDTFFDFVASKLFAFVGLSGTTYFLYNGIDDVILVAIPRFTNDAP